MGTDTVVTRLPTGPDRPDRHDPAALVTVRFGEFLRERNLINDEQWLAALGVHWSETPRRRFGDALVELGVLPSDVVEEAAGVFHDGLDVVEVHLPAALPSPPGWPGSARAATAAAPI